MKNLTLEAITRVTGGTLYPGKDMGLPKNENSEVSAIVTDSRQVTAGSLFVAIAGERVDGHRFLPQVAEQKAAAVLAEKTPDQIADSFGYSPEICQSITVIVVDSTLQAVKDIAEFYLKQLQKPIAGIVGSVGKTSTKEMVAHVLEQKYRTLKTEGNFNNELGVPMTAFRMREEDEIGVLEMGINHFGEMHRLAKIVRPHTVIMTNIGTAHLEFLESRDGILRAKSEVFDYFAPDGHIILNGDDDKLSQIEEKNGVIPIRFGMNRQGYSHLNDVWAENIVLHGMQGISCTIHLPSGAFEVQIPTPGRHMVQNALAGAAAGYVYGLSHAQIKVGIESYVALRGRFHIIHGDKLTIVDDCYNANPASMMASIDSVSSCEGRKTVILGDMGELGSEETVLHESIGRYAVKGGIDVLICIGTLASHMADAAREEAKENEHSVNIQHFDTVDSFLAHMQDLLQEGDTVLVKASHYMHFEKIVSELEQFGQ